MKISEQNRKYNQLVNRFSSLYHSAAVKFGFSDTQYWLLYALYKSEDEVTQNDLAIMLSTAKQTINSAISKLVREDILTLKKRLGCRNSKTVELTEKGVQLCDRCIKPLIEAEERANIKIPAKEMEIFLSVYEKKFEYLSDEIARMLEGAYE